MEFYLSQKSHERKNIIRTNNFISVFNTFNINYISIKMAGKGGVVVESRNVSGISQACWLKSLGDKGSTMVGLLWNASGPSAVPPGCMLVYHPVGVGV